MHMTSFLAREPSVSYIYILDTIHNMQMNTFHRTNDTIVHPLFSLLKILQWKHNPFCASEIKMNHMQKQS